MKISNGIVPFALAIVAVCLSIGAAHAQEKVFRIGILGALSGPVGDAAGRAITTGTELAVKAVNARGGVEGYQIETVVIDAGSTAEKAVEATRRLLADPSIDMIMSNLSSSQCAAMAGMANAAKRFTWLTACTAAKILNRKQFTYVFRTHIDSSEHARAACRYLFDSARSALGVNPGELKVGIVHEDGAYGRGLADDTNAACSDLGIPIKLTRLFPTPTEDFKPIINELKSSGVDIVLHAAYYPDVVRFLTQAAEAQLTFKALIGQGGGYSHIDALSKEFGDAANFISNVDPATVQLIDPSTLRPGLSSVQSDLIKRYKAATGGKEIPSHATTGYNSAWILLTDVLPRAIRQNGGTDPEALRKSALATDTPEGGTIQGYGVKFAGADAQNSGQNRRAFPVVMQYHHGVTQIVWPDALKTAEPVLPLPGDHPFADK